MKATSGTAISTARSAVRRLKMISVPLCGELLVLRPPCRELLVLPPPCGEGRGGGLASLSIPPSEECGWSISVVPADHVEDHIRRPSQIEDLHLPSRAELHADQIGCGLAGDAARC